MMCIVLRSCTLDICSAVLLKYVSIKSTHPSQRSSLIPTILFHRSYSKNGERKTYWPKCNRSWQGALMQKVTSWPGNMLWCTTANCGWNSPISSHFPRTRARVRHEYMEQFFHNSKPWSGSACNQKAPSQMSTEWGHFTVNYTKDLNINKLKCLCGPSIEEAKQIEQKPHWRKTYASCSDSTSNDLFL